MEKNFTGIVVKDWKRLPRQVVEFHLWKPSNNMQMWCLGTELSGGPADVNIWKVFCLDAEF